MVADYYGDAAKALAPLYAKIPTKAQVNLKGSAPVAASSVAPRGKKQGVLSWLSDMLSRPEYAVTNTVDALIKDFGGTARHAAQGKLSALDFLAPIGDILTKPAEGFFSTQKKNHPTGSQVVQDFSTNVLHVKPNPIVQGAVGFALDLGLDPLTYVPGAAFVKVGKGIKAAAKGGLGIARTATKAKDAEQAATAAAKVIDRSAEHAAAPTGTVDSAVTKTPENDPRVPADNTFVVTPDNNVILPTHWEKTPAHLDTSPVGMEYAPPKSVLKPPAPVPTKDVVAAILARPKTLHTPTDKFILSQYHLGQALTSPEAGRAKSVIDYLLHPTDYASEAVVKATHDAAPLSENEWRHEMRQILSTLPAKEMPKIRVSGKVRPLQDAFDGIASGSPHTAEYHKALSTAYQDQYLQSFAAAREQGKLVDALGRPVPVSNPAAGGAGQTVASALDRFTAKLDADSTTVQEALGPALVNNLKRYKGDRFTQIVTSLAKILDGSTNVLTLKKLDSPTRKLLKQVGLEPTEVPLGVYHTIYPKARAVPAPKTVQDMAVDPKTLPEVPAEAAPAAEAVVAPDAGTKITGGRTLEDHRAVASAALRRTIKREILEPKDPKLYPYATEAATKRTEDVPDLGLGRNEREFNQFSSLTLLSAIRNLTHPGLDRIVAKSGIQAGLSGRAFASARRSFEMPPLRLAEQFLTEHGVPITLGVGDEKVLLSPSQVLDVLSRHDKLGMDWYYWNHGTGVADTNLWDAVTLLVNGKVTGTTDVLSGPEGVRLALRQAATRHGGKALPNNLVKGGILGNERRSGDSLVEGLATLLEDSAGDLRAVAEDNALRWSSRAADEAKVLTQETMTDLVNVFNASHGIEDLVDAMTHISPRIGEHAAQRGATQVGTDAAGALVGASVPKLGVDYARNARAMADTLGKTKLAKSTEAVAHKAQQRSDAFIADTLRKNKFDASGATEDFGQKITQAQNASFYGAVRSAFDTSMGNPDLHNKYRELESLYRDVVSTFSRRMNALQKGPLAGDADRALARQAFANVRQGIVTGEGVLGQATAEMAELARSVFGSAFGKESLIENAFARNGLGVDHLNMLMEHYGLSDHLFDMEKAGQVAVEQGISEAEALYRQWMTHTPADPLDYLSKMHTVLASALEHQTMAHSFTYFARSLGAVSTTPKPGFSRVLDTVGHSVLAPYLEHDLYYENSILRQMHVVDNLMNSAFDPKHEGVFWDFVNKYYEPSLNFFKWAVTLPNPTHHFRNFVGDDSLTLLANGSRKFMAAHRVAMQAMVGKTYTDADAIRALKGLQLDLPGGKIALHGKLKPEGVSAADIYNLARSRGNLPGYRTIDLLNDEDKQVASSLGRAWDKISHSRYAEVIGGVSEFRDHYSRVTHFTQFLMQNVNNTRKYKSWEKLVDAASESTRKWHPDGMDMSRLERNVRLVIPFYAWTRKAIPRIFESILTHPARVTAFNKASYNLAVSMGVNPDSFSDPFPTDQMFPSYITQNIYGPQFKIDGHYFSVSPGLASWDILDNNIAGNPVQNIVGQAAPMIQAPFEIATKKNVGTGGDIHDWSDYLDSKLPFVSTLARLTGFSPTGSVKSLVTTGKPDPTYSSIRHSASPGLSLLNWLTGAHAQDDSKPNVIRGARLEHTREARGTNGLPF